MLSTVNEKIVKKERNSKIASLPENQYIRVGVDYFKIIEKIDRFGIVRTELKKWNKDTLETDFYKGFAKQIKKYDDFVICPDNKNYQSEVNNCYNLYKKFSHKPKEGTWEWTKILLDHIFGTQYEIGLKYLQVLYLYPIKPLPILVLVSRERQTGKSTFIDWISVLFGANFVLINPQDLISDFNGIYATSNIIAIEEAVVEKAVTVEKIKALSTQKNISTNIKNVQNFMLPFFGKIMMASNNEDKFIKIDDEEIRFFVRKLSKPNIKNHQILDDLVNEIPAFLHFLESLPEPDFNQSRTALTPAEITNHELETIKKESKPNLYKELYEMFLDFFNNEFQGEILKASARDIKVKFFNHDNSVGSSYIKEVLINHFSFEKATKNISYKPFSEQLFKTGQPFFIKRGYFSGEIDEKKDAKNDSFDAIFDQNNPFFDVFEAQKVATFLLEKINKMAKNQELKDNDVPF